MEGTDWQLTAMQVSVGHMLREALLYFLYRTAKCSNASMLIGMAWTVRGSSAFEPLCWTRSALADAAEQGLMHHLARSLPQPVSQRLLGSPICKEHVPFAVASSLSRSGGGRAACAVLMLELEPFRGWGP